MDEEKEIVTERSHLLHDGTSRHSSNRNSDDWTTPTGIAVPFRVKIIVLCILLTELCERLTYYSVSANLVLFANTHLGFTNPQAASLNFIFTGTGYAIPIFSGFIADSFIGQFNTIYGSSLIYIIGSIALVLVAAPYNLPFSVSAKTIFYIGGLAFIAIGTGGLYLSAILRDND